MRLMSRNEPRRIQGVYPLHISAVSASLGALAASIRPLPQEELTIFYEMTSIGLQLRNERSSMALIWQRDDYLC